MVSTVRGIVENHVFVEEAVTNTASTSSSSSTGSPSPTVPSTPTASNAGLANTAAGHCSSQNSVKGLASLSAYVAARLANISPSEAGAQALQTKIVRLLQHCPHLLFHIFEMIEIHALSPSATKEYQRLNVFFINFFKSLPDDLSSIRLHRPSFIVIKMLLSSVRFSRLIVVVTVSHMLRNPNRQWPCYISIYTYICEWNVCSLVCVCGHGIYILVGEGEGRIGELWSASFFFCFFTEFRLGLINVTSLEIPSLCLHSPPRMHLVSSIGESIPLPWCMHIWAHTFLYTNPRTFYIFCLFARISLFNVLLFIWSSVGWVLCMLPLRELFGCFDRFSSGWIVNFLYRAKWVLLYI